MFWTYFFVGWIIAGVIVSYFLARFIAAGSGEEHDD